MGGKGVATRQREAFRSQLRVMLSFVSWQLGPIYVRMSRVARDAFNTAASDDTDLMRQTGERTVRRGGAKEALYTTQRQTTYGPPLLLLLFLLHVWSLRCRPLQFFKSLTSLPNKAHKAVWRFCIPLQPTDRFTSVSPYAAIWTLCVVCLFRPVCMHF